MKRLKSRSRFAKPQGFTLVELLVVIGIIVILAAVISVAGTAAIRSAKRAKANSMAANIQTAVMAYYTEYGVYPIPSTATAGNDYEIHDTAANASAWGNLIYALCGNVNPYSPTTTMTSTVSNTRSIAFLQFKATDVDSNPAPLNPFDTVSGGVVSNGTGSVYFNVAMDGNYDGILGTGGATGISDMPNFAAGATTGGTTSAGAAVWVNCNVTGGSSLINYRYTY